MAIDQKNPLRLAARKAGTLGSRLALATRGSWGQFAVAALLVTVLPVLILLWIWLMGRGSEGYSPLLLSLAGAICVVLVVLGYALLLKYPVSITRLRQYLKTLTDDRLPGHVDLTDAESDIDAIRNYLEQIVLKSEERLRLIQEQHEAALEAERHRIMIESIGALCHHVGQPATVLGLQLHLLKGSLHDPSAPDRLAECEQAFDDIVQTLDQLRHLTHYRSEAYLAATPDSGRILHVPAPPMSAPDVPVNGGMNRQI